MEHSARILSPLSYVILFQQGGAVSDVEESATAYPGRASAHSININGVWKPHQPAAADERAWVKEFFAAVEPYQLGAYVNFLDGDEPDRVRASYGDARYDRLAALKRRFDPDNVFRHNHNIVPG